MIIKVRELCSVDYINEEDPETEENLTAVRNVIYDSPMDTLLEAFKDYDSDNWEAEKIISTDDEFDGGCLGLIKFLSVEEVESI